MSLLIEALKKAEDDAKKRKLASASNGLAARQVSAVLARPPAVSAELKLAPQSETPSISAGTVPSSDTSDPERVLARSPEVAGFPELTLASTDFSAPAESKPLVSPPDLQPDPKPSAQHIALGITATETSRIDPAPLEWMPANEASTPGLRSTQAAGRSGFKAADKSLPRTPRDPVTTGMTAARSAAYSGGVTDDAAPSALAPEMAFTTSVPPTVTPRQAMSAASVMAGTPSATPVKGKQRRQAMFLGLALLIALPVTAFYLFGDALLSSTGLLSSSAIKVAPLPAAVSLPSGRNPVPLVAAANPASEATAVPLPAKKTRAPVPRPARVTENTARASTALANQASPALITNAVRPASLMQSAYAAYEAGKPDEATRLYREVLKSDPGQRDAWLGLAVIAHAGNQREPAMDAYKRVLRIEPQNATALAGLSSLNNASDEPRQESRLRELLARSPQEADLNHALGLVLSGEQRWSEAQPLFFKAHALAPQEPKFAYNLAIALDHLRKSTLAIQYYETALTLAKGQSIAFDEQSARHRLAVLKAAAAENKSP